MTIRIWTCSVLLTVAPAIALAPVFPAVAAVAPSVAEREAEAGALFEAGKHDEAIKVFEDLYAERKSPNYLYNIARIQEDAGDLDGALSNYEAFVASPGVELELRASASERATTIREIVAARPPTEPSPPAEDPPPAASPERGDASALEAPPPRRDPGSDDGSEDDALRAGPTALGITGYVFLGTGVVALAAGGVLGGLAVQDEDRLTSPGPLADAKGLQEDGKRKAVAADVLFAVGGTFAAAGLTMVIVDAVRGKKRRAASASARQRRLTFSASGDGVMLGLGGRL